MAHNDPKRRPGYSEISESDEVGDPLSAAPKTVWKQPMWRCGGIVFAVVLAFHAGLFVGEGRSPLKTLERSPPSHAGTDGVVGAIGSIGWKDGDVGTPGGLSGAVLVTGATGRTGSILYHELRDRGVADVRAFVRDVDKARSVLGCDVCDESEGIYVGDATRPEDLERAMHDGLVTTLAIAIGGSPRLSPDEQRKVEFDSVVYSVGALARSASRVAPEELRVVLCSSMGTNNAHPQPFFGDVLFWKLNAEAYLATSGIRGVVIVKPCGLAEGMAGGNSTLVVGHNGTITEGTPYHMVSREDVAGVMAEAATMPYRCDDAKPLRFDLCSRPGPAMHDLGGLIIDARWEWDNSRDCV